MKLISLNIELNRHHDLVLPFLKKEKPDVICLQELKAQAADLSTGMCNPATYQGFFHYAEKKGYSGVAVYSKTKPIAVRKNFGASPLSEEGRLLELEFEDFYFLNCYFPNGGQGPHRGGAGVRVSVPRSDRAPSGQECPRGI